jgi:hypothetical protein
MSSLPIIVRATQAAARAIVAMQRWTRLLNDMERDGHRGSPAYEQARFNLNRAQRRYANAHKILDQNPL